MIGILSHGCFSFIEKFSVVGEILPKIFRGVLFLPHRVYAWRRGVVVSGVRRMNEVNPRRTRYYLDG